MTVAVCIPAIPPRLRNGMLGRALQSVFVQTVPADEIHVAVDHQRQGAAATRNRAWQAASTEWVAFLDDDDAFMPWHLEACLGHADLTGADIVYPWCEIMGGTDPFTHFGKPWDPAHPVQTTVVTLFRRDLLEKLEGFQQPSDIAADEDGNRAGEDFDLILRANDMGAHISHLPQRTWWWHHHGTGAPGVSGNTSGLPSRW